MQQYAFIEPTPQTLFVEITTECNLRCRQCHMWATRETPGVLTTEEKLDLISQFSKLNPSGGVVFTGGEPFQKPDQLLSLSEACRDHGLLGVVNTNATYLSSELILRVLRTGPQVLVVSLDSHRSALHDYVRGVPGTFDRVTGVTTELVARRPSEPLASESRLYLSSILFNENIADCAEFIEFAKSLGVDGVTFQMLDRTFWLRSREDSFFEKHWFHDATSAKRSIDGLIAKYASDPFLLLDERDLEWMKLYIDNPHLLPEPVCGSHERNLMVDMYGDVQLCAYMKELLGGSSLGNARRSSLADLWRSKCAQEARPIMDSCRRPCGMLNCHRKQSAQLSAGAPRG